MVPRLSPLFTWRGAIADTTLPASVKGAAFALSLHMSERGDSAFPSLATLAHESGLGIRTVRRALRRLEAEGWLVRMLRSGKTALYQAVVPDMTPATVAGVPRPPDPPTPATVAGLPRPPWPPTPATVAAEDVSEGVSGGRQLKRGAATWLTPYVDCHVAVFPGSAPPVGPMLKALRPLDQAHGAERVVVAQRRYLEDLRETGRGGFLSYLQFAATFSQWEAELPRRDGKARPTAVTRGKDWDG